MTPRPKSRPRRSSAGHHARSGFTLIELLVVMLIILLVSAVALPVIIPALSHREVTEAARLLQGALVGARDAAIHANAPRGIRLLPDPNFLSLDSTTGQLDPSRILAANRIVALEPAPDYSEGRVNVRNLAAVGGLSLPYPAAPPGQVWPYDGTGSLPANVTAPVLIVEEALSNHDDKYADNTIVKTRNAPTSWFWNVRLGDKIQIGNSGTRYTVVGPMTIGAAGGNPELFVNIGLPGQVPSPLVYLNQPTTAPHEFLFVVNNYDDNGNGFIDEGWDGVDNDLDLAVDDLTEWAGSVGVAVGEIEHWLGGLTNANNLAEPWYYNLPYTISRRPTPSANARETMLPASVVVDLTTWSEGAQRERSRLPVNQFTGNVDIMLSPQGEVLPNTFYSSPTSFTLADSYFHFWLAERADLYAPSDFIVSGPAVNTNGNPTYPPFLPTPQGFNPNTTTMYLKGESRLLTLFTRNGQIAVNEISDFDTNTANYNTVTGSVPNYNPSLPLIRAQQGVRGGQ